MTRSSHLTFDPSIGRQKPESIINRSTACPFCDKANLENILAEKGPIILLKNKYPTLKNTNQTVLIETETCEEEFSRYDKQHLYSLIEFSLKHWIEMIETRHYKSVLLFKNHGPFSGGSLHHSHMQIVGLNEVDYTEAVTLEQFEGITIAKRKSVLFTISTKPKMGFYEFNVIMDDLEDSNVLADFTQIAVHYILNHFPAKCGSYNLFFYQILPRFATSPLYVGYSIAQVAVNLEDIAEEMRMLYIKE